MDYNYAQTLLYDKLEDTDEDRIDRIFAILRPKDKDSRKWNDQIKFWSRIIKSWGKETGAIAFSVDLLSKSLTYNEFIPQLKPTIDYLVSVGVLKTRKDITSNKSFLGSISSKLLGFIWSSDDKNQDEYIFVDNLKNKVNSIISEVENDAVCSSDIVLTFKEFEKKFRDDKKYPFDLILAQLDRDKRVKKFSNGYYFNVGNFSEYNFGDEVIQSIIQAKENIALLDQKIDIVEKQIDYDLNCAKSFKKQNRIKEAKSSLIHKKMLENVHDNYYKMKNNLEAQLNQFEQSHTIKKVASTLRSVNEAMKTIEMPTLEEVDKIMDDMQDYKEVQDEIVNAVQMPELENMDEQIEDELSQLPDTYEEAIASSNKSQDAAPTPNNIFNFYQLPQAEQPQEVPPARLKTPKQLAHNPIPQFG